MAYDSLFGTSGVRGPADKLFTKQFCFDIARAFTKYLAEKGILGPIAVGMDPRTSSPRIKADIFEGLATADVELFDEGATPIPSLNWLLKTTPIKAAIMVTGSHISPELNGVKFYAHEEEVLREDQDSIEKIYRKIKGRVKAYDANFQVNVDTRAQRGYSDMLFSLAKKKLPKWKVALDCANGAQSVVMPYLLERLGMEVVEVNCEPHKDFIARDTDTDDQAMLDDIKKAVVNKKCDFGLAFDGDGDRSVFIDEKGNFVKGEYTCTLVAKHAAGNSVVTTIAASQVIDTIGKKIYRTRVGSPYVVGKMKETNTKFGFEQNGGAISSEIMYTRDGGALAMKVFNIFGDFKGSFSKLIKTLPEYHMARTKIEYEWELKDHILEEAKKHFKGQSVDETDGLKIWIDDNTWILFRSSQNAPEFRVFAESKSKRTSDKLMKDGMALVRKIVTAHGKN